MVVISYNPFSREGKCLRTTRLPTCGFLVEESNTPPRGAAARSLRLPRQLYMKRMEVAGNCRPVASNALECAHVPLFPQAVPESPLPSRAGVCGPRARSPKCARHLSSCPRRSCADLGSLYCSSDSRCTPKGPAAKFPVMHVPHCEFRQGDRRVEQVRLTPEVPVVVHEVHSQDNIGLPVPVNATSRVEQLQYLQLGFIAVNVPNIHH